MDKICFAAVMQNDKPLLVCAHERSYDGKGSYIARDLDEFERLDTEKKIECMNDMIIALINHVEVKDNIQFGDYQRQ